MLISRSYVNLFRNPAVDKSQVPIQESEGERFNSTEFIDDYRLLAGLGSTSGLPPFLVLIDTEDVGGLPRKRLFTYPANSQIAKPYFFSQDRVRMNRPLKSPWPPSIQIPPNESLSCRCNLLHIT